MTRIKICGIKETENALAAAQAGADFIGMVFARSPRRVSVAQAQKIVTVLKESGAKTQAVGVFVNMSVSRVRRIADLCQLDWVQLSGDEPWEYCSELNLPIIKAIRVSRYRKPDQICADLTYGSRILSGHKHMFLLDSGDRYRYGGTGRAFNWELARLPASRFPVIIAGGLTPENVGEAIRITSPWGVDVSSGVETERVKDETKIKQFVETVRRTDGG